jgi:hypothetical protein
VAPGPDGGLLVLSAAHARAGEVTLVARRGGAWTARALAFAAPAGQALLAAAGGRWAVVVYQAAGADLGTARCRLALVDARAGAVAGTATVCRPGERVDAVALTGDPAEGADPGAGPVAYLGIRPLAPAPPGLPAGATPRIVAVEAATGRVVAGLPLEGVPSHLVLAPGADDGRGRLYAVEALAPPSGAAAPDDPPRAAAGRLLDLDPETLEVHSAQPLARAPLALAVAPDGAQAYVLVGRGDPTRGDALTELDLRAGGERPLAGLPGGALDLAATAERVYASSPERGAVWALDRRTGQLAATLTVGRAPARLALGPAR